MKLLKKFGHFLRMALFSKMAIRDVIWVEIGSVATEVIIMTCGHYNDNFSQTDQIL